jgi:hypothetical protein
MILWILMRDPDEVVPAGDGADRGGPGSGYRGLTAAAKVRELLREDRKQVEDVAKDLLRRCRRGELEALLGQDVIGFHAWAELTVDFTADGTPFVRREIQQIRHGTASRLTKRFEQENNGSSRLQQTFDRTRMTGISVQQSLLQGITLPQP